MSDLSSRNASARHHEPDRSFEPIRNSALQIIVMDADSTQQRFIQDVTSSQHSLTFLSSKTLRAAISPRTFSGQGLLLFLVPAEYGLALQQIRIMKWISSKQPRLSLIPLIPSKAVWDVMRELLAKHFPIYLAINFLDAPENSFSSRLRDCTVLHLPQIFEALASPVLNDKTSQKDNQEGNGQLRARLANLRELVLLLEQKLALNNDVGPTKNSISASFPRVGGTASKWGGDYYLLGVWAP